MVIKNIKNVPNIEIAQGRIISLGKESTQESIDATDLYALPLSIDLNLKNSESVYNLHDASLQGGVGTALMIPYKKPITDKLHLEYNLAKAREKSMDLMVAIEAISEGKLSDISQLISRGAKALFINSDEDLNLIKRVFEYASMLNVPIFIHPFSRSLSAGGVMHDSFTAYQLGLSGISDYVESVEVAKILELSRHFDARIVFQNITSKTSLEILKNRSQNVYVDVCIDNLLFNDTLIAEFDTRYKTMPPIRGVDDQEALLEAVRKKEVDFISSNHVAVPNKNKDLPFEEAEYGMSKLDIFSQLLYSLDIDWKILEKMSASNPATLFGLERGVIKEGKEADLMLVRKAKTPISTESFKSRGKNSPLAGEKTDIEIVTLIKNGQTVYNKL